MSTQTLPPVETEEPEAPSKPSLEERFFTRVFRPKLLLLIALSGATLVLAPAAARLVPDLAASSEYRLKATDIVIPNPPRWVPKSFLAQVLKRADIPEDLSVLDRELVSRIGHAFERHPWVASDVRVRITIPARLEVSFDYREPTAMIAVNDGFYPVDEEGLLLPPDDFPMTEVPLYPRVIGVGAPPSGRVGENWGDARVTAAARLAHVLSPHWDSFKLDAIEVPKRETAEQKYEDLEFVLLAKGGSRIIWGRAPGSGHPLEITDDQKIGRIQEFLAKGKSFDGPWEVHINLLMEITYQEIERLKPPRPVRPTPQRGQRSNQARRDL